MERCRFYEHQPEQQLATIKNRQAWLPFMFNFMAEKSSDGLSLFTFCDVIMKCKLTWSTDYGFQRGSFFILGIFVCEWKNLNGFAEARDCLKRSSNVRFIFTENLKLLGRQFPERCDGQLILAWWDAVDIRKWMAHPFGS